MKTFAEKLHICRNQLITAGVTKAMDGITEMLFCVTGKGAIFAEFLKTSWTVSVTRNFTLSLKFTLSE